MVATLQIGRKLIYKRRQRWFLQRAVQQAVTPQVTEARTFVTPAEILAQWDAEGMGNSWVTRTDIGDSSVYARTLRAAAERREINR